MLRRDQRGEPILAMIVGHFAVVRVLRMPPIRAVLKNNPKVVYRYWGTYLARSLSLPSRRQILTTHYSFLMSRVNETFFDAVVSNKPTLWDATIGAKRYAIRLSFTGIQHYEGDLLLELEEDSIPLYQLAFTIAPGRVAGADAPHAMLIARIQGVRGQVEAIRRAARACCDIAPPHLLMAAAQGIAAALRIGVIAGVKNKEQLSATIEVETPVSFDYDAFWHTYIATEASIFYLLAVPIPDKPLRQIKPNHRQRTRLKRLFKHEVTKTTQATFSKRFLR